MNISHIIYFILITVIIALSITIAVKSNQIKVLEAEKLYRGEIIYSKMTR